MNKKLSRTNSPSAIVCSRLDPVQKQDLCDEAMKLMIAKDHGVGAFQSFLKVESDIPAPALADSSDPYKCKKIPIEGIDVEKPMYWCKNRVYKNRKTAELYHADGFFMSGSEKTVKRAFMFRQSPKNNEKVVKWAKLDDVDLLKDVTTSCCAPCLRRRTSRGN